MKQEKNINGDIVERALAILNRRQEKPKTGITLADVLGTFPGARILATNKPDSCPHCEANEHARIVVAIWPSGKSEWICHACGRAVCRSDSFYLAPKVEMGTK